MIFVPAAIRFALTKTDYIEVYPVNMTIEAIKAAIQELSQPDRQDLANWFEEQNWDAEMEYDFSPGGRGYDLVQRINNEIDKGNFSPLEKGLHQE